MALYDLSKVPLSQSLHLDKVLLKSTELLFAAFRWSVIAAPVEKGDLLLLNHGSVRHFFRVAVENFWLTTTQGLRGDQFKGVTILLRLSLARTGKRILKTVQILEWIDLFNLTSRGDRQELLFGRSFIQNRVRAHLAKCRFKNWLRLLFFEKRSRPVRKLANKDRVSL